MDASQLLPGIVMQGGRVEVVDPLAWLEADGAEARAWADGQAKLARDALASLPGSQGSLADRIRQAMSYEGRSVPLGRNGRYLFHCSPAAAERVSLWQADAPADDGREILAPDQLDLPDGAAEMGDIWPSPDGRHAVLAVTHGGRQRTQLVLIAVDPDGPATIRERLDTQSFAWVAWHDEASFFLSRRRGDAQVLSLRTLEQGETSIQVPCDTTGAGLVPIVSDDGAWLVLLMYSPGVPGCRLFASRNSASPAFIEVGGFDSEHLVLAGWRQDGLVLVPRCGNGREIVLVDMTPLAEGNPPVLRSIHRDDTGRLSGACALPDGGMLLVDRAADGGNAFRHRTGEGRIVPLDGESGVALCDWTIDRSGGCLLANFRRWETPAQLVRYDPISARFHALRQSGAGLGLRTSRAEASASDGTRIPVTLLKPSGMDARGAPCLLMGYGGFGIGIRPYCMMTLEPWVAAGGMIAIAHVRGGDELGPAWHEAAKGHAKLTSFTDFVAVARWLAANGHTSADRLCLWGQSAGGLLVLGSAVLAPDFCRAVIAENPVTDMANFTRFQDDGRYWTVEFGDTGNDEAALAAAARWSPLHNLKVGQSYPASLISVGSNDERVSPIHGRKMTAAFQATGSKGPHLLMERAGRGHGGAHSVSDTADQTATMLRFAAWATGLEWRLS